LFSLMADGFCFKSNSSGFCNRILRMVEWSASSSPYPKDFRFFWLIKKRNYHVLYFSYLCYFTFILNENKCTITYTCRIQIRSPLRAMHKYNF
jgi:hypothetical protein